MTLELPQSPLVSCVFDWYQATTNVKIDDFQNVISKHYDYADWDITKGANNYHHGAHLMAGGNVVLTALWGGPNGENVHAFASGYEARKFSQILRDDLPIHRVTRADGAIDFIEDLAWENVERLALHNADKFNIKVQHLGDFHKKLDGRTLNLGGQKSDVRATIYEKGIQLGEDPNWVRMEVKVRPPKLSKEQFKSGLEDPRIIASRLSPIELFGCSTWSKSLLLDTTGVLAPSVPMRVWGKSDFQKSYNAMLKQYKNVFSTLLNLHGSSSAMGAQIEMDLLDMQKNQKK